MNNLENLQKKFKEIFKTSSENIFFSPGRVNLIGEHTDYNGGHVFPCALSIGTYGLISKRNDKKIIMNSLNFKDLGSIEFNLEDLTYKKEHNWVNYPKGVIKIFKEHGFETPSGLNILIYGDIPNGSGLSSSASLELLMAVILKETFNFNLNMLQMVKYCQEAENKFIGVNCGIMDQFAIGFGKKDSAVLLDCNTLKYKHIKINMNGFKIVISNTNKQRGLADSKYNERRSECETALKDIQKIKNINSLGELTENEFEEIKAAINNPICLKRARHAVYENQRTLRAVKALEDNDMIEFGKLMTASHNSLRDDYEVTGIELDTLVSLALSVPGVIGSRMTGAGFGGCTVSIVEENAIDNFIETITKDYTNKIGYAPDFYVVNISDGARKLI